MYAGGIVGQYETAELLDTHCVPYAELLMKPVAVMSGKGRLRQSTLSPWAENSVIRSICVFRRTPG
ncbi:MAG: hypothetical protein OXF88_07435 [Rhodobacteraceae bacterium]|nr:hypothetical protein [Paracoccaceae bacterium]MCY4138188.1 hypothetical protein [Paracoccaceae bacterium]